MPPPPLKVDDDEDDDDDDDDDEKVGIWKDSLPRGEMPKSNTNA